MDEATFLARFPRVDIGRPHPGHYRPPALPCSWEHFGQVLKSIAGELLPTVAKEGLGLTVASWIAKTQGRHVASRAAAALLADGSIQSIAEGAFDPHSLADVELGIVTAELAIAETAAVLLTAHSLPERALAFLAEQVLVLVREDKLVADFNTAQTSLPVPPPFYLTWVAGPSKTADIEQALVIGAHGPRRLLVMPYQ